jgi:hypothetical protein
MLLQAIILLLHYIIVIENDRQERYLLISFDYQKYSLIRSEYF